jgi:hypothetical protein
MLLLFEDHLNLIIVFSAGVGQDYHSWSGNALVPLLYPCLLHGKSIMGPLFGGVKPKEGVPILADKYLNKVSFIVYSNSTSESRFYDF